ncbi:MAG TPA: RHS repeat-associated core domain-containing protein [Solirubrobacterales bacterium]|nr:RHS repeat-associated core domain-containing protein [Solirubrobacterales bacterium]
MTAAGTKSVQGIQGDGVLVLTESTLDIAGTGETWQLGSLRMNYKGNLSGAGSLEVTNAFGWDSQSTMSGTGRTILGPSAVSTIGSANVWFSLIGRTLVNKGTVTQEEYSILNPVQGGVFENLGTYHMNGRESFWQISSDGTGSFVNKGLFDKTVGTGEAKLATNFENFGTIKVSAGKLRFEEAGHTVVFGDGGTLEGPIVCEKNSVILGSFTAPSTILSLKGAQASVAAGKTAAIGTLVDEGTLGGPGTLKISNALIWEGAMSGPGSTVIESSATATVKSYSASLSQRTFVNNGTLSLEEQGSINASEGATLENHGTLNANAFEVYARFPGILSGGGAPSRLINTGTIRKSVGSGNTRLNINIESTGTIAADTGTLLYNMTGATVSLAPGSVLEGRNRFQASGLIGKNFTLPNGIISARESPLVFEGSSTKIAKLQLEYEAVVSGPGDVELTEALLWEGQSTLGGSGKLVLGPNTINVLDSGATTATLSGRTLVNQGIFTQKSSSRLNLNGGAIFKNRGTYNLNSEPYPTWIPQVVSNEGGGSGRFVNSGQVQRTEGSLNVKVVPQFENQGVLNPKSSKIEIENPDSLKDSEKKGCSKAGDPVSCASGNFSESQADIMIGGRGIGLNLIRAYSAQAAAAATAPGLLGYGWTGSFSDHLTVEEGGAKATLTKGDGSTVPFALVSGSTYAGPAWSQEVLSGSTGTGYTLTELDQTQYRFSGSGKLESIIDRNGNQTTLSYESGRLKAVTDPTGRQLTFAYNAGGQIESVTDPMGHVVKYGYASGNLSSVTMPGEAGPRWQFEYDSRHRITQIVNGRGGKTTNQYDSSDRVVSQTDPAGRTITFKYEAFHTTITNQATGAVTDEWFTSYNEPYSVTHGYGTPQATTSTFAYDEAGHLIRATDGLGHTTLYGYDIAGNRTSEKDPLGHESLWSFNATHELISASTPGGETTTIKRDSHGNVESISRPAPGGKIQTSSFKHDQYGLLESVTDPLGRTWSYGYDSYGNRTSETDPLGQKQTLAYDKDSRLVSIVSPRGNLVGVKPSEYETKIERDLQGRPVQVADPLGHVTSYAYDGNGNLASLTDAAGHTTKYAYNADDERTAVEKPNGAAVQTSYDGAGYVTAQTDGNGRTTTYVRNVLEQPVEVIDPLNRKTTESFDGAGNLVKMTDPSGRETSYSYDSSGELVAVEYSDLAMPDASFQYDPDGNLTVMTDGTGKSTFTYDQLGRLTKSQDGHGGVVEYQYDLGEQQVGIVYPNGKSVARKYDAAGRLESLTDWLGGKTSFLYDADSNLKNISFPSASGNLDEYSYNRASQMSEARFKKGSETLASLSYTRDALGQVEEEARIGLPGAAKTSFGYDVNNRLTKAGSSTFEYDNADNLTSGMGSSNSYDAASQLEKGTGATYTFDKQGERTSTIARAAKAPTVVRSFGGGGTGASYLAAPRDVDTDKEGNVYIADTSHNRIQVFNSKGEFLRQFGAIGSGNGMFSSPRGIAVNKAAGTLYVADAANNRIQQFNLKGEFIRKWGSGGSGNGQFTELQDLALDSEGHVWTVEGTAFGGARVQEFSSEGTYITQFGKEGAENGQFKAPEGIAVDGNGNVWVADTANNRIQAFKPNGEFIRKWGTAGSEAGQLTKPRGIAFDAEGKVWVTDSGNDRLQRFTWEGAYLAQFGAPGNNSGQFAEPRGVAIDSAGNIWVADAGNNRVVEAAWPTATTNYSYDQGGNLTSIQRSKAGEASAISESFTYDATGLLASKTSGLVTRYMAWDASTDLPLLLHDGENSYVYGPNGLPIEQISLAEKPTYLHHDQLGSTRMLTNSSGESTASFSYAPYGSLEAKTGTATTPLGFAGQYTDTESGLQYLRARFYDPGTGQFMTRDPFVAHTRTPYAYGLDDPLRFIDPSGLSCVERFGPLGVYPNIVDCYKELGEETIKSPLTSPAVTIGCLLIAECTPLRAAIAGLVAATSSNLLNAESDPCFDFLSHEIESLLVLLAGGSPGALVDTGLARAGGSSGLTPLGERILHIVTDTPGVALDVVHAMTGG